MVLTLLLYFSVGMELGGGPGGAALPPALAYLASVDQLIVKQKKEMLESKFLRVNFKAVRTDIFAVESG